MGDVEREIGEGRSRKEDKRGEVYYSAFASHFSHLTSHYFSFSHLTSHFFLFFSKKEII